MKKTFTLFLLLLFVSITVADAQQRSVAREWNEKVLQAIRGDFARPTVHARNLFHVSAAMWDAWSVFEDGAYAGDAQIEYLRQGDERLINYAQDVDLWQERGSLGTRSTLPLAPGGDPCQLGHRAEQRDRSVRPRDRTGRAPRSDRRLQRQALA